MNSSFKYKINKIVNFYFVEISLFDRIRLFKNHLAHSLKIFNRESILRESKLLKDIFIISLPIREDRREFIKEQFNRLGLGFQFIDGVNWNNDLKSVSNFRPKTIKNLTHGALGCAAAHIKSLEKIKNCPDGLYIVLEDDVVLLSNFKKDVSYISSNFPIDCDIFYIGTWNKRKRDLDFAIEENIFRSFNPRKGMYGYIVTPRSAEKILKLIIPFKLFYGGIDTKIGILVRKKKIVAYQNLPSLVQVNFNLSSNIYNPSDNNKALHSSTKRF